MKTIYLDCGMGAAGDMLTAALLELCPEKKDWFLEKMNGLGLPGVRVAAEKAVKCGITGTHINVTVCGGGEESADVHDGHTHAGHLGHPHEIHTEHAGAAHEGHGHTHASLADLTHWIAYLALPDAVKRDVEAVYTQIAKAESQVHGKPVSEIHFHEVGTADALADIAGFCLLVHELAPEQILASPVHVGSGQVRCAHGILPVPAPATAHLLRGIPMYSGAVKGELCTPTGAALLKHFVTAYTDMPVMIVERIGYGMGKKDFDQANCVRALLGETAGGTGKIVELSCNLDDMTAEAMGFVQELLLGEGALEVYTIPIGMKKNRPGTLLTCMCKEEDCERMARLLFRHTTTLGIREQISRRYTLKRHEQTVNTPYGPVREKVSAGYGTTRRKYEYEDLARIAREQGLSLAEVQGNIEAFVSQ